MAGKKACAFVYIKAKIKSLQFDWCTYISFPSRWTQTWRPSTPSNLTKKVKSHIENACFQPRTSRIIAPNPNSLKTFQTFLGRHIITQIRYVIIFDLNRVSFEMLSMYWSDLDFLYCLGAATLCSNEYFYVCKVYSISSSTAYLTRVT